MEANGREWEKAKNEWQNISTQRRKDLEQEGRNQNEPQRHRDTKKSDATADTKNVERKSATEERAERVERKSVEWKSNQQKGRKILGKR